MKQGQREGFTDKECACREIVYRPTFQFYKGGKKVAELKGANPTQLEQFVKDHQGGLDGASSSSSSSGGSAFAGAPGHVSASRSE